MSFLFGKKKAKPAVVTKPDTSLNDSIVTLKKAMNMLDKREEHLGKELDKAHKQACVCARKKDKRGAVFQLRRKKRIEKQIDQIYGKKTNIEMQIMALDEATSNKRLFDAMKAGKNALKSAINEDDIEEIDEQMAEITESMELAQELSEAMSQPIGNAIDDDDIDEEFANLEAEMVEDDLMEMDNVPIGSKIQGGKISIKSDPVEEKQPEKKQEAKSKEQNDLDELEAMMM